MHASKDQQDTLHIIKNRSDFVAAAAQGRKWVSHGLILQIHQNSDSAKRVGYTVTKRTEKSAVKRNRIKRRLRAVAADVLPGYALDGYDFILIGRSATRTRPYDVLCNDLRWCLRKMDCTKKQQEAG